MALQGSGTISNSNLKSEFLRSANPNQLSLYYRGGGIVPSSRPGTTNPPTSANCNPAPGATVVIANVGYCQTAAGGGAISNVQCGPYNGAFGIGQRNFGPFNTNASMFLVSPNNAQVGSTSFPCGYDFYFYPSSAPGRASAYHNTGGGSTAVDRYPCRCVEYTGGNLNPAGPGTTNPTVAINTGVPTSGQIKLSNFYGATR